MQENSLIKKLLVIEFLMFVAWCMIALIFADYDKAGFYFWGGFSFGVAAFIISGVSLFIMKKNNNRNTTEPSYIAAYITGIYLVMSLLINVYFIIRCSGKWNIVIPILNVIFFIAFISFRIFTDSYVSRVDTQTRHIEQKLITISSISAKIGALLSLVNDPEVKKMLYQLKESVDYSSNVSQSFAEDSQNLFLLQLNQIQSMILEKKDSEEIKSKIFEASVSWKTRNSTVTTTK